MENQKIECLVRVIKPVHQDARRSIWEPVNEPGDELMFRRMDYFDFSGSGPSGAVEPVGNHYHEKNMEVFFLADGRIERLVIENILTKDRAVFEDLGPGTRILMPIFHAHAMYLASKSKLIAACSHPFNEDDKDLHPYALLARDGSVIPGADVRR